MHRSQWLFCLPFRASRTLRGRLLGAVLLAFVPLGMWAQQIATDRGGATILVEPYAPNIVRVSLSLRKPDALAGPGYGVIAKPSASGWEASSTAQGDVLRSSALAITVAPEGPRTTPTGTQADIAKFFNGSTPYVGLTIKTADGKTLLRMNGWQMSVPNYKDGNEQVLNDRRPTDPPFFQVGASFAASPDEHDYGLGQNQEGYLDRRGHVLRCAHDYNAPSGQSVCVPFVVTNKGYALLWAIPRRQRSPSASTIRTPG